mmetsp:Transcript_11986/g.31363  ORF Transcript_11986/g.31363 Transcript_11986/m.31363 type:complete len:187 (-) Transcript_11986:153-713(-)
MPSQMRLATLLASMVSLPLATTLGAPVARLPHASRRILMSTMPSSSKRSHAPGVFAPLVLGAKQLVGDSELNKLRGKVIAAHTKAITSFVETYNTPIGERALALLFAGADANKDGMLDTDELASALRSLGFRHLSDEQISQIFARADVDESGAIDFTEFVSDAPRTLRVNLIKLAKQNGAELGLLA